MSLGATSLLHEAYLDLSERDGSDVPRPPALHGLRRPGDARPDHRLRPQPPGPEARRAVRADGARHRCGRSPWPTGPRARAGSATRSTSWPASTPSWPRSWTSSSSAASPSTEIAAMKGISERTVQRHWQKARLYLHAPSATRRSAREPADAMRPRPIATAGSGQPAISTRRSTCRPKRAPRGWRRIRGEPARAGGRDRRLLAEYEALEQRPTFSKARLRWQPTARRPDRACSVGAYRLVSSRSATAAWARLAGRAHRRPVRRSASPSSC